MSTSIANTLTEQLREAILSGAFVPNSKIRLEELSASYGVSMSPIREALLRLSGEGFVVSEAQRGFRVADATPKNLEEVTALRAHLEPFALRLAIGNGDQKWEENLVVTFHRLTRIEEKEGYVPFLDEWEKTHRDFHLALLSGCGMPMLIQFCSMLHDQSDRYRRLFLKQRPPQRNVAHEHASIIQAVIARDADKACDLLLDHIRTTGSTVETFMSEAAGQP
ncbi:HTH-type transcriptional repressor CsiR [Pigmentiphaga humi]|uniref:HTH-type transcriptional repressor CsiR n=1 Tax=Pigmentiphaga humi TaxID=2478468 RepID=A0A3P4B173_9BURK|nr:GntR family transcriptional regulator [Pigmentiphaga humi]VCU68895.1 HTH-type transcriptional repressor CsiR [Pigmentiphaga humi]